MRLTNFSIVIACLLVIVAVDKASAADLQVDGALLTLIEQVELPAKEAGGISSIAVKEGQIVERGQSLAAVEDDDARLAVDQAKFEFEIAESKSRNDVTVRFAKKSQQVADAEYRRAKESGDRFKKSISETEMDELRLTAERAALEIEQAEQLQTVAKLTSQLKGVELAAAHLKLERRRITAPFDGMIVQVKKHRGEWVSPGDTIVRMIRLDRLRVETFLPARDATLQLNGSRVTLLADVAGKPRSEFSGTVVFVSPEINAVNGQVRVWAEVDNKNLLLRPGQQVTMSIGGK